MVFRIYLHFCAVEVHSDVGFAHHPSLGAAQRKEDCNFILCPLGM